MLRIQGPEPLGLFEDFNYMKSLAIPLTQFTHLKKNPICSLISFF